MDEKINGLQAAVGSMAEMTYMFYKAMIGCGASEEVALSCANTFISVTQSAIIKHALNLVGYCKTCFEPWNDRRLIL